MLKYHGCFGDMFWIVQHLLTNPQLFCTGVVLSYYFTTLCCLFKEAVKFAWKSLSFSGIRTLFPMSTFTHKLKDSYQDFYLF